VLAAVFVVPYAVVPILRFRRLETASWDNAIFEQALKSYAHLHAPVADIKGPGFNILGDHFSPIIAVLAPVYALLPHAQTLMVAQAVLLALSIVPIARVGIARLGLAGGVGVALGYGLSFGLEAAVDVDFHEVAFAAPLLALAGAAWLEQRWTAVVVWSALLLLVKEDLGLTVAMVGVVLLLGGVRRQGLLLLVGGVLAAFLVVLVVVPAFSAGGDYTYLSTGDNAGRIGLDVLFSGLDTKVRTLLFTFGITGFLALRSPWSLLTLPTLAWRFATDKDYYWGTDWHYGLVLMPIVFVALLDGIARAQAGERPWLRRYAAAAPTAVAAVGVAVAMSFPFGALLQRATWQASPRAADAQAVLRMIPDGAVVETDVGLITHLAGTRTVYWVGTSGSVAPTYLLVDNVGGGWSQAVSAKDYAEQQNPGTTYRTVFDRDGYQLARKVGATP
jgi:uncharacterized membrane protein